MNNVVRIDFHERDQQWIVTLTGADGGTRSGEPFPAFGGEGFSKLEQVISRMKELGYRPTRIPYNKPNATRYIFEVEPI
ncbi:hypothetical protein [Agromyces albus]|uniref:Uncharacterized protein n=1 Tax=Agromyces albus TaxID=205332 RepID=A0A4Q2L5E6_9MICO|nr:hypothetical protein [Agromyces albus]RXZ72767.1 hypothetical protein ESP51_02920 [Agromyces albus]